MGHSELAQDIYQTALMCGFDRCGIISLDDLRGFKELYQKRMRQVPSGAAFYQAMNGLTKTKKRFPWAKSLVICVYWYGKYRFPAALRGSYAKAYFLSPEENRTDGYDLGQFERWFAGQGIRCEGGEQFGHLSVGPLRYAAMMAGLGIIRKNNFFYTEKGSYVNLVGYVIDRECRLIHHSELKPCGESCSLCQDACKTKALSAPYTFDPVRCVSFWTTFGKGVVPPHLKKEMFEAWICGCDSCQDACPHNRKHNWEEGEAFSDLEDIAPNLIPERVLELSDEYLIEHVIPKTDRHMKPTDAPVLRRNAERAIHFCKKLSRMD